MKSLILRIVSRNDIITNSSTEILSIKTTETPEILKELILNYALANDGYVKEYGIVPDEDVRITKIDPIPELTKLFGELTSEEKSKFIGIACKRYGLDPSISGELYMIDIEHHLDATINFLQKTLGAV